MRVTFAENDGRAPDTVDALKAAEKDTQKQLRRKQPHKQNVKSKKSKVESVVSAQTFTSTDGLFKPGNEAPTGRQLASYRWDANSCYVDVGLELLFRAFVLWRPDVREQFLQLLGTKDSLLASIYFHYQKRLKWILDGLETGLEQQQIDREALSMFELGRGVVRNMINNVWKLYPKPDSEGCAVTWMNLAVWVSD